MYVHKLLQVVVIIVFRYIYYYYYHYYIRKVDGKKKYSSIIDGNAIDIYVTKAGTNVKNTIAYKQAINPKYRNSNNFIQKNNSVQKH